MKYITKNIKQFYILKWHNLGYTKEKCPSASEKKLKIRLLKEKKLLRGKLKKKKKKNPHKWLILQQIKCKQKQINFKTWSFNGNWKGQKSEMNAQMIVKMYSSFTWGPIHIGGVEGTSRSGMVSGGWNNRTIQTSSITIETRNSGSTIVRQGELVNNGIIIE